MKTIHNINKWSFIVTALLYCTIYFGLLAQVPLGAIQIILAIVLLYKWKHLDLNTSKHLTSYFMIVIVYGLLWLTDVTNTPIAILYFTLVPMSIAGYFLFITSLAKKTIPLQDQKAI